MRKDKFYAMFIEQGEKYAATLDGPGLIAFNEHFEGLSTIAASALNRPIFARIAQTTLAAKRLTRARQIKAAQDARAAKRRARNLLPA